MALAIAALCGCGERAGDRDSRRAANRIVPPPPGEIRESPLPERKPSAGDQDAASAADGATLFERIDPADAGIDFVHLWAPRDAVERDQLGNAFAGGGAVLGDIDGDGLPEVLLTRQHGGPRLYRNLGGFRFEDITASALPELSGHWSTGATFAEVDGDGNLDLYLCGYRSPSLLLRGDGQGKFTDGTAASGLAFSGAAVVMAFADYDRDGDLDGYLLTNRLGGQATPDHIDVAVVGSRVVVPEEHRENIGALILPDGSLKQVAAGQADRLFRNDGNGRFTEVTREAGIEGCWHGLSATWWDHDVDGYPDLYVANDFYGPDHLYRNNGDGTFTDVAAATLPHTPWFSMGSDAGDLNNDGLPDFIATDMSATSHYKQKVNMGDMDENGWFLESANPPQYMRNAVFVHSGTPRFQEAAHLTGMANTDWTWAVKILDLDEDGLQDVFFGNGMTRPFFHADLRAEIRRLHTETGENLWHTKDRQDEHDLCFRNLGDLAFDPVGPEWGLNALGVSFGAAAGDLDQDGDLDLVVNSFENAPLVYRNRSHQNHRIKVRLHDPAGSAQGIGARVDVIAADGSLQTRWLQPIRGFMGCDDTAIVFGLGSNSRIPELRVQWGAHSPREQVFRDLAADQLYEISAPLPEAAPANPSAPSAPPPADRSPLFTRLSPPGAITHGERPFDDFAREPLLPNRLSSLGPGLVAADIDGDGDADLHLGGAAGRAGQLLRLESDGTFIPVPDAPFAEDSECEDLGAVFFDADRDGDLDLYVVSGGVESDHGSEAMQDRLYLNAGDGTFSKAPADRLPDMRFSGGCVAAADYDRDGDYDLFVGGRVMPGRYPMAPGSRLLRNDGNGFFTDATDTTATTTESPGLGQSGMVTAALWTDTDGDGWVDLLVGEEYGPLRLHRNEEGVLRDRSEAAGIGDSEGWWNGLAGADVDADGDIDFVATNFGLNTKYHVSPDAPQIVYLADFGDTGVPHIVEAHPDRTGLVVPVRGRSCSSSAMPFLREKFPTFHEFASATLDEIYSDRELESAFRREARVLESMLFLNDGNGRFDARPLPRAAQIAPAFGAVFLHADGDPNIDLFLAQNFFGPQRETGRMDGGLGLLLLGDGTGGFTPLRADRSGIVIPEDATAAVTADIDRDGATDLLVAVNDSTIRAYRNETELPATDASPALVLIDRHGASVCAGARITIVPDAGDVGVGTALTFEIAAGSGYLSQSPPVVTPPPGSLSGSPIIRVRWPDGSLSEQLVASPEPAADADAESDAALSPPRLVLRQPAE